MMCAYFPRIGRTGAAALPALFLVSLALAGAPSPRPDTGAEQTPNQLASLGVFRFESGETIDDLKISYVTHGKLSASRDNAILLNALQNLADKGTTLVVVEHDEETIRRADYIIDIGPGAGKRGGRLVTEGSVTEISSEPSSVTGRFLAHPLIHPLQPRRRSPNKRELTWQRLTRAHAAKKRARHRSRALRATRTRAS